MQITRLVLQLPIDRCAATIQPTIGAYTVIDGAFQDLGAASLPAQAATCRFPTLPTEHLRPGIAGVRGPFLRGVDYDVRGDQATTYLHWCGPGPALHIQAGETSADVAALGWGDCQTVRLPTAPDRAGVGLHAGGWHPDPPRQPPMARADVRRPLSALRRRDGLSRQRHDDARRPPHRRSDLASGAPHRRRLRRQRAVARRRRRMGGRPRFQPGLSALPTLKWVVGGPKLLDPHPFDSPSQPPEQIAIAVYERFRLTPLASPQGDVTIYPLP